jgi:ubiquinone/menaquinone biosynthesis C-methylase UbiE
MSPRRGSDQAGRVAFRLGDATQPLPFDDASFDALMCIDSMNHFPNRLEVFREWRRVLRPGGRALFTDPVAITGLVTNGRAGAAQLDRTVSSSLPWD